MTDHKYRKGFEVWVTKDSTLSIERDGDGYTDLTTELMWRAWLAAKTVVWDEQEVSRLVTDIDTGNNGFVGSAYRDCTRTVHTKIQK